MTSILPKDMIISEILPYLPSGGRGPQLSEEKKLGIIQLILYKFKTGCQWDFLPIRQFMDEPYSAKSVFHHFNKWSKSKVWERIWVNFLEKNKAYLDLSSAQIDGTHTPVKRGGEQVGYQGRKSSKTSNMICISDRNGVILTASPPNSGNHHDLFEIEKHMDKLMEMLKNANISSEGLFLNGDAGFDSKKMREVCFQYGIEPNLDFNKRNGIVSDREDYFDSQLYKDRQVIEHTFAWLDAFKTLLVRYEKTARNWFSWNLIGFLVIFARKITTK